MALENLSHSEVFSIVAIIISIVSVIIGGLALGWNIYRDVVLKPRLKVTFGVRIIIQSGVPEQLKFLILSVTNHGPGLVKINMVSIRRTSFWLKIVRKGDYAVITMLSKFPYNAKLPVKLEVGDRVDLLLDYEKNCFLKENYTHIGIRDSFGRVHWANKKDLKMAYKSYHADF